jgi:hypothetical protein
MKFILKLDTTELAQYGKVEQFEVAEDGNLHVKITKGFDIKAKTVFKVMELVLAKTDNKYPLIVKCQSDKDLFHLILKSK